MSAALPPIIIWLTQYTGFPARRLPAKVELMLLFAAAAESEERIQDRLNGLIVRKDSAQQASHKQLAENRRRTHFKCDNRTAV